LRESPPVIRGAILVCAGIDDRDRRFVRVHIRMKRRRADPDGVTSR
jgi:hypothetical protein